MAKRKPVNDRSRCLSPPDMDARFGFVCLDRLERGLHTRRLK
jgi:hypothetical protein